jgi:lipopolysaccharide biosynthesis regulator YciM
MTPTIYCHRCSCEMKAAQWRCPSCEAQNRLYSRVQMVAGVLLALVVLFFMRGR